MNTRKLLAVAALTFLLYANISAQTTEFTYQGHLQVSSMPANGSFDFEFALYDAGGSQIGPTLTKSGVTVTNGVFSVNLDFGPGFSGGDRFLEIRVRSAGVGEMTTLSPRQPVNSSPYSIRSLAAGSAETAANAQNAVTFSGALNGDITGTQGSTTVARLRGRILSAAQPNNGQVLKFNLNNNQWEPANDETASAGSGGTITGITAGTGLTGGGTTGSVTVGIANGGVNTAQLADESVTDAKIVGVSGAKVTGAVANATNAVNAVNATNAVNAANATTAATATNAATAATAANFTGPLAGDVTGTQSATTVARLQGRNLANIAPVAGQVLKYDGTQWVPDTDNTGSSSGGTITGVTAGTGLTGGGTTGNVTVGISNGGVNTAQLADGSVTDAKITGVSGAKITGTVANSNQLGGIPASGFIQNSPQVAIAGSVGIGTSNPAFKLEVIDPLNNGLRVQTNTTGGTVASFGGNGGFFVDAPGIGGGRLAIMENGRVGIGTNTPQQTLHVNGLEILSTGPGAGFKFRNRGSSSSADDWVWFSENNIARLWRPGVGDLFGVTAAGAFRVGGAEGQAGQVITSNGAAAAQWKTPTNLLYQRTNMNINTGSISPAVGSSFATVPGLTQMVSVPGNAKFLVQFGVHARSGGCTICDSPYVQVAVFLNGLHQTDFATLIVNGFGTKISGSWLLAVGPGNHTVEIRARTNSGPNTTFGAPGSFSSLIVQVIPE
jgi:hypothetical protein